jgi:hypothetical protein
LPMLLHTHCLRQALYKKKLCLENKENSEEEDTNVFRSLLTCNILCDNELDAKFYSGKRENCSFALASVLLWSNTRVGIHSSFFYRFYIGFRKLLFTVTSLYWIYLLI